MPHPLGSCAITHTTFRFVRVLVGFVLEENHMPKIVRRKKVVITKSSLKWRMNTE